MKWVRWATPCTFDQEYIYGPTLREKLGDAACTLLERLGYLAQAARGLARAHSRRIVHCDLKPDNIMLTRDGLVKVLDFGLVHLPQGRCRSRDRHLAPQTVPLPARLRIEGTIGYLSPEQAAGRSIDTRSDVFSFGCMLFEAATNRLPFGRCSAVRSLDSLMHETTAASRRDVAEVPPGLQELVDECLAKDRAGRLPSMGEVSGRLNAVLRPASVGIGRRTWAAAAIIALGLVGCGLLAVARPTSTRVGCR